MWLYVRVVEDISKMKLLVVRDNDSYLFCVSLSAVYCAISVICRTQTEIFFASHWIIFHLFYNLAVRGAIVTAAVL